MGIHFIFVKRCVQEEIFLWPYRECLPSHYDISKVCLSLKILRFMPMKDRVTNTVTVISIQLCTQNCCNGFLHLKLLVKLNSSFCSLTQNIQNDNHSWCCLSEIYTEFPLLKSVYNLECYFKFIDIWCWTES